MPGGVQPGLGGQRLEQLGDALAGQVAAAAARREQPARPRRVDHVERPHRQPRGQRLARGTADRHHPLLVALAAHGEHGAVGRQRRQGQSHQLAHPQTGGVEQLEQGDEPEAVRAVLGARRRDQRLDLARPPAAWAGGGPGAAGRSAPRDRPSGCRRGRGSGNTGGSPRAAGRWWRAAGPRRPAPPDRRGCRRRRPPAGPCRVGRGSPRSRRGRGGRRRACGARHRARPPSSRGRRRGWASQAQGPAGAGGECARIALQAQREQGVERAPQGDRAPPPPAGHRAGGARTGAWFPAAPAGSRARSRATGTGSAAIRAPAPTVWRSSFQTVSGIAMPSPSTSAAQRARCSGGTPATAAAQSAGATPFSSERIDGPGRAGATTAARAAEARPGLSASALRAGTGRLATAAGIEVERHRAQERQEHRVVGHRRPQREAGARHRGAGEAGEVRIGRDVQGHEAVEPELDGRGVAGERGTDHRGLGPGRALVGAAPAAVAGGCGLPGREPRPQPQRIELRRRRPGGACASSSKAVSASPIASSRSTRRPRARRAPRRRGRVPRAGRAAARASVGSSIAVGSRRSSVGDLGRRALGPERAGELRLRAGQARGQRCRRRQVLHADRRCGLARTRLSRRQARPGTARAAPPGPAAGRLTSQVAKASRRRMAVRPSVAVARRARRSRPDGSAPGCPRRRGTRRHRRRPAGRPRGAGAAGQDPPTGAAGARIADGHDGTRRKLTVASLRTRRLYIGAVHAVQRRARCP